MSRRNATAAAVPDEALAMLLEMGFSEQQAREALSATTSSSRSTSQGILEGALEKLMAECPEAVKAGEDKCECAICCDDIRPGSRAMRCTGEHGRRHYYHAKCLSRWIQHCQESDQPPTCPQCKGGLQVQTRKLRDFLAGGEASSLSAEERRALRAMHDAANRSQVDDEGFSCVSKDEVLIGVAIGLTAVGVGLIAWGIAEAVRDCQRSGRNRSGQESRGSEDLEAASRGSDEASEAEPRRTRPQRRELQDS